MPTSDAAQNLRKVGAAVWLLPFAMLTLAACNRGPDNSALAEAEARRDDAARVDGRIACALEGEKAFSASCTLDRIAGPQGNVLIIGRTDTGFRRLLVTTDGRGLVSADGSEPAVVTIVADGEIEVAIGRDRYRLPATVKAQPATGSVAPTAAAPAPTP